jgi:hypothetical protein
LLNEAQFMEDAAHHSVSQPRYAPAYVANAISTVRSRDHCFAAQMLLHERDCLVGDLWQVGPSFARVQDPHSVPPCEATRLQPRIWEAVKSVPSEKEKSADGRNLASVVFGSDSQVAKSGWRQFPDRCKQLGSSSEVERFRVQIRDGLLVKRFELAKPTHFSNLRDVGTPICGSQANEDARFRPKTLKVVGARRTWVNLHY